MNASRFDTIAKLFAARRLSRRQAVAQGGIAAGVVAASRMALHTDAQAQEATPAADGEQGPTMLFLQAFQSGGVTPAEGAEGRYTLTLEQGLGHTVYFSDRPDRIVGAHPTPLFLEGLGFPEDNPPNAALVVETAAGQTEIAVVELFNPRYDEETHTATYEVEVLGEWERSADTMSFIESDADLAEVLPEFGAAHLFIDDCANSDVWCETYNYETGQKTTHGYWGYDVGHCYSWEAATCLVCGHVNPQQARATFDAWCNATFPSCTGQCRTGGVCTSGITCAPLW
jgi:hypothetical protein